MIEATETRAVGPPSASAAEAGRLFLGCGCAGLSSAGRWGSGFGQGVRSLNFACRRAGVMTGILSVSTRIARWERIVDSPSLARVEPLGLSHVIRRQPQPVADGRRSPRWLRGRPMTCCSARGEASLPPKGRGDWPLMRLSRENVTRPFKKNPCPVAPQEFATGRPDDPHQARNPALS